MKHFIKKLCALVICLCSCNSNKTDRLQLQWIEEIRSTEQAFATLLKEKGLHEAFIYYADEDAVIMRNNTLIIGKMAIKDHYKDVHTTDLSWMPDFIDVSKSGDLGYTYGTYNFKYKDSLGNELIDTGVFHTIWKRQKNGAWKFVWD